MTYANPENAWLTEDTALSFAQAVGSVHADTEVCRQKTAKARRTAEQHSWPRITDRYFQLYDRLHTAIVHKVPAIEMANEVHPERDASGVGLPI